ncbi:asparaginase [Pseudaminobacter arsenicus]|uniref:Asparaginase n=1 Tax=Borborobacter arsenicus TaxID=1851146 RepID=A0A432V397_9HYPH|nr:asparaginase [Pseudaminobacter arsenicus]RUM96595.1 asparaginase [Pseudaminobacter arsenicus]
MSRPKVHIIVLGGTITMAPQSTAGIAPSISGAELVAAVPALAEVAAISVATPFLVPGASLSFAQMRQVDELVDQALDGGAHGVVVVQGTDTIDETGFLLDLTYRRKSPVVVTGAMRGANAAGADGNANLLAAVTVAASPAARDLGVLVVLNDEIHAARFVAKQHKALPSSFASPGFGPLGHVIEGRARIALRLARIDTGLGRPAPQARPVALVSVGLGDDDRMIRAVSELGYKGLVIEAMGAGHLPGGLVAASEQVARAMPVILASRVPGGPIFASTYGFPGSEIDLIGRGLIGAGLLSAHKARLLLSLLVGAGRDTGEVASAFASFQ